MAWKTLRVWCLIGLCLPLLLACGGAPPPDVTAKFFLQEFVDDMNAAVDKYEDQRVRVSGEVVFVESGHIVWGKPYIAISAPGEELIKPVVACLLSDEALAKDISSGDSISVEGTVFIAAMTSFLIETAPEGFELILNKCSPVEVGANQRVDSQPTPTSLPSPTLSPTPTSLPSPTLSPTPTSLPPPTNTPQAAATVTPVPFEWVAKTDEDLFSIEIPSRWVSTIKEEDRLEETQAYLDSNVPGTLALFQGLDPMTNSNVLAIADFRVLYTEEPQPIDLEEYTEMQLLDLGDSKLLSVSDINIGGLYGAEIRTETIEGFRQNFALLLGDQPKMGCGSLGIILIGTVTIESQASLVEKAMNSFQVLPTAAFLDSCDDRKALSFLESSDSDVPYTSTIKAVDLVEEFNSNAVVATQKYSGSDLIIEGEVTTIDYDYLGDPYVAVGSGDLFEWSTVWCMVSDVSDVAGLSVGDKVTVAGTFFEWDTMDVVLKPCSP